MTFSFTKTTIFFSSPKPRLPGRAAPRGFAPGTTHQRRASHVLCQQTLTGGCGSCGLPWYIYAMLQLHWGPPRYSCHVFCSSWRIPVSKPHCHHTTSDGRGTVGGHKHLCATHVQLRQRRPHSENPGSKSSRTLLASAQHCCTGSHIRHFSPQITPTKSMQRTGRRCFYKGDRTAGSNS